MYIFGKIFSFLALFVFAGSQDLDELNDFVTKKLQEIANYKLPSNNEKLFTIKNSTRTDAGTYDFIIVGAGAAGSVLANRLSEIKGWKILLLEAGGKTDDFSDIPIFNDYLRNSDMNWGYFSSPQTKCCQGMRNNQCVYPRGKVIGGTTTINGAVYARGSHSDYNAWQAMGNPGWSYKHVLQYFTKSEDVAFQPYDRLFHGNHGLLVVNETSPTSEAGKAFVNAHKEKGLPWVDYNGKHQLGVSKIQFNVKFNKHHNAAHAFLDPINHRENLKIILNAAVNKIMIINGKASGVTFVKDGNVYKVRATREVIISAGAINSPQLLMLSGIGPAEALKNLSIPLVSNSPAVGQNLQDHPLLVNLYFRTNITAPNRSLKDNLALYLQGETPFTNGAGLEHLAFINTNTITRGEAEIEYLTFAPPFSVPPDPVAALNLNDDFVNVYKNYNTLTDIAVIMSLMKPKSKGKVTLKSNNIIDFPIIDFNYFSDPQGEDLETMYKGVKYILSLTETQAFKNIGATFISKVPPCEQYKDNDKDYWYCALKYMTATEYHPSGTTRMGLSKKDSVVNKDCVVHDICNLRVVDAGVMPDITRGHLMAGIYMIAEKISDRIKERYGKRHN